MTDDPDGPLSRDYGGLDAVSDGCLTVAIIAGLGLAAVVAAALLALVVLRLP